MVERSRLRPEGLGDELHRRIIKVNRAKVGRRRLDLAIPSWPDESRTRTALPILPSKNESAGDSPKSKSSSSFVDDVVQLLRQCLHDLVEFNEAACLKFDIRAFQVFANQFT